MENPILNKILDGAQTEQLQVLAEKMQLAEDINVLLKDYEKSSGRQIRYVWPKNKSAYGAFFREYYKKVEEHQPWAITPPFPEWADWFVDSGTVLTLHEKAWNDLKKELRLRLDNLEDTKVSEGQLMLGDYVPETDEEATPQDFLKNNGLGQAEIDSLRRLLGLLEEKPDKEDQTVPPAAEIMPDTDADGDAEPEPKRAKDEVAQKAAGDKIPSGSFDDSEPLIPLVEPVKPKIIRLTNGFEKINDTLQKVHDRQMSLVAAPSDLVAYAKNMTIPITKGVSAKISKLDHTLEHGTDGNNRLALKGQISVKGLGFLPAGSIKFKGTLVSGPFGGIFMESEPSYAIPPQFKKWESEIDMTIRNLDTSLIDGINRIVKEPWQADRLSIGDTDLIVDFVRAA